MTERKASPARLSRPSPPSSSFSESEGVKRTVLVTVGTTRFDALIDALDKAAESLVDYLIKSGYNRLVLQIGTGEREPTELLKLNQKYSTTTINSPVSPSSNRSSSNNKNNKQLFTIESFKFSHTFKELVTSAGLIISHAGAGSILEALRVSSSSSSSPSSSASSSSTSSSSSSSSLSLPSLSSPPRLVVVVNDKLMDNHQLELAQALSELGYLYYAHPNNIVSVLMNSDWSKIKPYPPIDDHAFPLLLQHDLSKT